MSSSLFLEIVSPCHVLPLSHITCQVWRMRIEDGRSVKKIIETKEEKTKRAFLLPLMPSPCFQLPTDRPALESRWHKHTHTLTTQSGRGGGGVGGVRKKKKKMGGL